MKELKHTSDLVTNHIFLQLWRNLFPYLCLRRRCNVIGKCDPCEFIDSQKKKHGGSAYLMSKLTESHNTHRVMYAGERKLGEERAQHAMENPDVCCIDIDIMEANDYANPTSGGQSKFKHGVKSVWVGALTAGIGLTLYRTTDSVKKSGNLIVEVLLKEIEKYQARHDGDLPKLLYVNVS